MSKAEPEDVAVLYDLAWKQFQEDREAIMKQYASLSSYLGDNEERYAISGDTLAKYAELMIKQTAQVLELVKLAKKDTNDSDLGESDYAQIAQQIEKERKSELKEIEKPKKTKKALPKP